MKSEKLCVVTGTSAGIGRAVAEALLEAGWRVLGVARREAVLHDRHYAHVRLDLADVEAVGRYFMDDFAGQFPAHDYRRVGLVNNAALLDPVGPLHKLELAALARAFTVNSAVPVWLMGFFMHHCMGTPLRIVNLSSGSAINARAGWAAYCASKAALLMAGRVHDQEAGQVPGTHPDAAVLSYEPGLVNTDMQAAVRGVSPADFPAVGRFMDFYEQGRLADPSRPAREIAAFLEQDQAPAFCEARLAQ